MGAPDSRRGFLRGLASLPLIGGSVALIGTPSAVAEPVSDILLETYDTWLEYERRWLQWERYRTMPGIRVEPPMFVQLTGKRFDYYHLDNLAARYHGGDEPPASTRAALVLSTVGCGWGAW